MSINHTNLADSPKFIQETKQLIESSFGYTHQHSFAIDFYPLFNSQNFHHCHILEENGKVLAHIGLKHKTMQSLPITMYGGISVARNARGKGLFQNLFQRLLSLPSESLFHILWSDKLNLYKKYHFYPAVTLNQYAQRESSSQLQVEKINWKAFQQTHLYENKEEIRLERSEVDWNEIKKISSSEVYLIKEDGHIVNYFVKNKGADLQNIIHEYGTINKSHLECMRRFGDVWSPSLFKNGQSLYGMLIKLGRSSQVIKFFKKNYHIEIENINRKTISFQFENKQASLSHADFLTGFLGPTPFKEFQHSKPIFISGLDSI